MKKNKLLNIYTIKKNFFLCMYEINRISKEEFENVENVKLKLLMIKTTFG